MSDKPLATGCVPTRRTFCRVDRYSITTAERTFLVSFHEGGYTIEADDSGELVFRRPNGDIIELRPPQAPCTPSDLKRANEARGHSVEREPLAPAGAGEGIDVDYITWAYFFQ